MSSLLFLYSISTTPLGRVEGVEVNIHPFLTSALYRDEWCTSRSYRVSLGKRLPISPGSITYDDWWTPESGLHGEEKNICPYQEQNHCLPAREPVASHIAE